MNQIICSQFRSKGTYTIINNPSPRVHAMMSAFSIYGKPEELLNKNFSYHHRDIGLTHEMEELFSRLDNIE